MNMGVTDNCSEMGSKGREASQVIRRTGESLWNNLSSFLNTNICTWVVSIIMFRILSDFWHRKGLHCVVLECQYLSICNLAHAEHAKKHNIFPCYDDLTGALFAYPLETKPNILVTQNNLIIRAVYCWFTP